jgi:hypothetical protein
MKLSRQLFSRFINDVREKQSKSRHESCHNEAKRNDSHGFPTNMLGRVSMAIINYEGTIDELLERAIQQRLMPLATSCCGFITYVVSYVLQNNIHTPGFSPIIQFIYFGFFS